MKAHKRGMPSGSACSPAFVYTQRADGRLCFYPVAAPTGWELSRSGSAPARRIGWHPERRDLRQCDAGDAWFADSGAAGPTFDEVADCSSHGRIDGDSTAERRVAEGGNGLVLALRHPLRAARCRAAERCRHAAAAQRGAESLTRVLRLHVQR